MVGPPHMCGFSPQESLTGLKSLGPGVEQTPKDGARGPG